MTEPEADLQLESLVTGQVAVTGVAGVVLTVIAFVLAEQPWVFLASTLVGGGVALGVVWPLSSRLQRRQLERIATTNGPVRRSSSVAVRLGVALGAVGIVAGGLVLVTEALVFDMEWMYLLAGPILLTFAGVAALGRRNLLRWQDRQGLVVCTRVSAPRVAWTQAQARARLVTVAAEATAV